MLEKLLTQHTNINVLYWAGSGHKLYQSWGYKNGGLPGFTEESNKTIINLYKEDVKKNHDNIYYLTLQDHPGDGTKGITTGGAYALE